jgi:hypothetical protein
MVRAGRRTEGCWERELRRQYLQQRALVYNGQSAGTGLAAVDVKRVEYRVQHTKGRACVGSNEGSNDEAGRIGRDWC